MADDAMKHAMEALTEALKALKSAVGQAVPRSDRTVTGVAAAASGPIPYALAGATPPPLPYAVARLQPPPLPYQPATGQPLVNPFYNPNFKPPVANPGTPPPLQGAPSQIAQMLGQLGFGPGRGRALGTLGQTMAGWKPGGAFGRAAQGLAGFGRGLGLGGAGGALGGAAGRLGLGAVMGGMGGMGAMGALAGGPAGLVVAGVMAHIGNIKAGIGNAIAGTGQMVGQGIVGNASGAMKGGVTAIGGIASLGGGPIFGAVTRKLAEAVNACIDQLDRLSNHFAKYNGAIAAAAGKYEAAQQRFNVSMGKALSPMLSAWNRLKTSALGIISAFEPVIAFFSKIGGGILDMISDGFKMVGKAIPFVIEAFKDLIAGVMFAWGKITTFGLGGDSFADSRKAVDKMFGPGKEETPDEKKALREGYGRARDEARGGRRLSPFVGMTIAEQKRDADRINEERKAAAERAAAEKKRKAAEQAARDGAPPPPPPPPPPRTPYVGGDGGIIEKIKQNVNFSLSMKVANEREVFDMIHQLREQALAGLRTIHKEQQLNRSLAVAMSL